MANVFPHWLKRLKRPGITMKLFLAVLVTTTVVAVLQVAATQYTFHRGFIGYLNAQAVARMDAALPKLQQAYRQHQSWEFVRHRPDVWFGMVGVERLVTPRDGMPQSERDLVDSDLLGAGRRMALLDAQRQLVIGFPVTLAGTVEREVVVDGQPVGWVTIAPVQAPTDVAAVHFLDEQFRATLVVASVGLVLASLVVWRGTSLLLAPVRAMARATQKLAAGAYDTRVDPGRSDEIGQLAHDFNHLALQLERNERMRRDFMADVSHELRTPLAVLRGELEALEDGIRPPTPDNLAALQTEVKRLNALVDDLYDLALADVGALTYRMAPLNLNRLLEQEMAAFRQATVTRGMVVQCQVPADPVCVVGDAGRLLQLLRNLLANALRYTAADGEVQVRLRTEGSQACIDVMDSPPGVPDEQLPRLFDRFFRVEGSRSRLSGGSGLGLAICRNIVEAHGGSIEARHAPLGGLWVLISLPRSTAEAPPPEGASA